LTEESRFMDAILDAAKKRVDAAEAFSLETLTRSVGFESGELKRISEKESSGVGLRVITEGRIGHIAASKLDEPEALVQRAVDLASLSEKASFAFPGPAEIPEVSLADSSAETLSVEAMIETGREAVDRLSAYDSDLKIGVGYGTGMDRIRLRNSSGFEGESARWNVGFGVTASIVEGGNILHVWKPYMALVPPPDPMSIVDGVISKLKIARKNVAFPSGKHRAILTPAAMADILMAFLGAVNGKAVAKGTSPLKDKLGQAILDPRLTLLDNGLHPEGLCSQPFDDEGVPVRRKHVVKNGVLETFLTDLKSASKLGTAPTGNAVREKPLEKAKSFSVAPAPDVLNVEIEPGDTSYETMLADTKLGLEIHHITGILLGNLINGDFSGTLEMAFKIEKGEKAGRVKDVMVAGNFYKIFKDQILAIEDRREWTLSLIHI